MRTRYAVRPVPETNAFTDAVRRGTRTTDGRPGPEYWQNHVAYEISAELDPATARITGTERVRLTNHSPDTLRTIVLNLYQNVFAESAQRTRRVPITGGMRLDRVVVEGVTARPNPGAGRLSYAIDGTLMTLDLPFPLTPDRTLSFEIDWTFVVPPRGAPRTGHDDHEAFVVAQWYPQVATYDDLRGWHDRPYWSNGEFYLEYADFEVDLTLPEGWLAGATGTLTNPQDVLDPPALERLARARASDAPVSIVAPDDVDAGRATARDMGGTLTWHWSATNVRDFAFATSDVYVWDAVRASVPATDPDSEAGSPGPAAPDRARSARTSPVLVNALYRPGAPNWQDAAAFMKHALEFHSDITPYPWPHITAAEGPIGGMEYPMLVFIGAPTEPADLYAVLSHEIAHQWWPMQTGSNETDHAWQDEGLATFVEDRSVDVRFPATLPFEATQAAYLRIAGTDTEAPIERPADLYGPGPQYGVATYRKPGTLLRALTVVLGDDVVSQSLREYVRRWAFRHPSPSDFFNTVESVAGRDLDWFWSPWFYDTVTLDQAITAVAVADLEAGGERVTITVEDQGGAPMPVPLTLTLENGESLALTLPVEPWIAGQTVQRVTTEVPGRVARIEIDAPHAFPDIDRLDNLWTRPR